MNVEHRAGGLPKLDQRTELGMVGYKRSEGFASGTVSGANTRRYHGLLLAAQQPGNNRYALVNHVEEWLHIDGEQVFLSTNCGWRRIHF
ncbi:MAG TPA: glycogen debranching enzyme N-terminal domain-containing protein [Nitrospira sp.]|jgi:glycogen debranching enzyme|nr:glycogen debranching enzyme N-terminal domain-containing protein [Nitrospira sp.]